MNKVIASPDKPVAARNCPLISVVIPTFKRPEATREAVLSAFKQDLPKTDYEVILVDSSPTDENARIIEELTSQAHCSFSVYRKRPEGPGASRNLGTEKARGAVIAFMDSDCQASPGWLRAGLAAFEENNVGLVQGKTLPDPSAKVGVFTWYVKVLSENFVYECANIFYAKRALQEVGGFIASDLTPNATTPMGGEDVDLAWRVKRKGWRSKFAEDAVVYHEVVQVSVWRWLFAKRLYIWPYIARRVPELRRFFVARYFFDQAQALYTLGLVGLISTMFTPWAVALFFPYIMLRGSESSGTLRGFLRPLRVIAYLAKDSLAFLVLLAGSLRYRTLLL